MSKENTPSSYRTRYMTTPMSSISCISSSAPSKRVRRYTEPIPTISSRLFGTVSVSDSGSVSVSSSEDSRCRRVRRVASSSSVSSADVCPPPCAQAQVPRSIMAANSIARHLCTVFFMCSSFSSLPSRQKARRPIRCGLSAGRTFVIVPYLSESVCRITRFFRLYLFIRT